MPASITFRTVQLPETRSFCTSLLPCGHLYRRDDAQVSTAPADVAIHMLNDLFSRCMRSLIQQCDRRHDHSGGAVTALHRVGLQKRFLYWMEVSVFFKPFDGRDLLVYDPADLGDA